MSNCKPFKRKLGCQYLIKFSRYFNYIYLCFNISSFLGESIVKWWPKHLKKECNKYVHYNFNKAKIVDDGPPGVSNKSMEFARSFMLFPNIQDELSFTTGFTMSFWVKLMSHPFETTWIISFNKENVNWFRIGIDKNFNLNFNTESSTYLRNTTENMSKKWILCFVSYDSASGILILVNNRKATRYHVAKNIRYPKQSSLRIGATFWKSKIAGRMACLNFFNKAYDYAFSQFLSMQCTYKTGKIYLFTFVQSYRYEFTTRKDFCNLTLCRLRGWGEIRTPPNCFFLLSFF